MKHNKNSRLRDDDTKGNPPAGRTLIHSSAVQMGPRETLPLEGYKCHPRNVIAAATEEKLYDLLDEFIEQLPTEEVTVALETMHHSKPRRIRFQEIDRIALRSVLGDYESLISRDGRMGISVFCGQGKRSPEVCLSDDKIFCIRNFQRRLCKKILRAYGLPEDPSLQLVCDKKYTPQTSGMHLGRFNNLVTRLSLMSLTDDVDPFEAA